MEIRVDTITFHSGSLHLGCVIVGPKGSWVRFFHVEVPIATISPADMTAMVRHSSPEQRQAEADQSDPLF